MHVCTPKPYDIKKFPMSAVTKVSTMTSIKKYQKNMEGKRENDSSMKGWYIKCEVYTTINKIYERVTKVSTNGIRK